MSDREFRFIEDKELNLKDSSKDLLHTYPYVKLLKKIICNGERSIQNRSFRIALYGKWGSGKSSIIKTVKEEIEEEGKDIKFILYDAWKFSEDSFRRSFLIEISKNIKTSYFRNLFMFGKFNKFTIFTPIVSAIIVFSLYFLYNEDSPIFIFSEVDNFPTYLMLTVAVLTFFFNKLWELYKKRVEQPEEFEEIFEKIIKNYFKGEFTKESSKKLIIIIDNIDRIGGKVAVDLLLSIRNFLNIDRNVIFIIPIDKSSIERAFSAKHEDKNYLKKLFNLEIYIKEHVKQDLFSYTKELIDKNFKYWGSESQISNIAFFISQNYSDEPRKILKFLNILNTEYELYEIKESSTIPDGEVTSRVDFLAKILIIREEWPDDYRELALKPSYFLGEEYKPIFEVTKSNRITINELINLKKEIHPPKPHYFLGWDNEKLDILSEFLDNKIFWSELRDRYNRKLFSINNDINIFLIALEYKFREGRDLEYLYKIIFDISNDERYYSEDIFKPLVSILKNNWNIERDYTIFYNWTTAENNEERVYKSKKKYFTNSAKNFSKYGESDFLRDQLLTLISNKEYSLVDFRLSYLINLFKSYTDSGNEIFRNSNLQKIFNEIKDDSKNRENYFSLIKLLKYKEFREINFFKDFYLEMSEQFWIDSIKSLKDIIVLYDYNKFTNIELSIEFTRKIEKIMADSTSGVRDEESFNRVSDIISI